MATVETCSTPQFKLKVATSSERRREPRYPCNDPVEIRCVPGDSKRMPGTLLDVSRRGLRVALDARLEKGSRVEILMPKQVVIFGEVRHCRASGVKFQVGILIEDAFYSPGVASGHVHDDKLALYVAGEGLSLREVVAVGQHLRECRLCSDRLNHSKLQKHPAR
ncbi:MAG TPA: PilZ domain-containing protein [Bryobacteraceae bacterium]|nr:PilZ domain-containing protein [Bryobacteraceae bacterium]